MELVLGVGSEESHAVALVILGFLSLVLGSEFWVSRGGEGEMGRGKGIAVGVT